MYQDVDAKRNRLLEREGSGHASGYSWRENESDSWRD